MFSEWTLCYEFVQALYRINTSLLKCSLCEYQLANKRTNTARRCRIT